MISFFLPDFSVGTLGNVTVGMQGLGILNWVAKKVIQVEMGQIIISILMTTAKELLGKSLAKSR